MHVWRVPELLFAFVPWLLGLFSLGVSLSSIALRRCVLFDVRCSGQGVFPQARCPVFLLPCLFSCCLVFSRPCLLSAPFVGRHVYLLRDCGQFVVAGVSAAPC